jgi:hypothetical protein
LDVPEWPWDDIAMDFVIVLPRKRRGKDAVWVVVDRLSRVAHFFPIRTTDSASDLASIDVWEIVRLYEVHKTITSDRDAKFVSRGESAMCLGNAVET